MLFSIFLVWTRPWISSWSGPKIKHNNLLTGIYSLHSMVHKDININMLHKHEHNTKQTGSLTISGSTSATCSDTRAPSVCTVKGTFPYVLSLLQASIKPCEKSIPTTWLNLLASSKVERPTAQPMSSAILGTLSFDEIKTLHYQYHHKEIKS